MNRTALIIVDVQYDFLPAFKYQPDWNGALAVPDGGEIIDPIYRLLEKNGRPSQYYDLVAASYDWHPPNHCSFIENGGEWPAHCVQNTHGAKLEQTILDLADFYVEKGGNPEREAYSAFDGFVYGPDVDYQDKSPLLADFLIDKFVGRVEVVGLALDYCVRATALDAVKYFKTEVLLDLTRPVAWETGAKAISDLQDASIELSYL